MDEEIKINTRNIEDELDWKLLDQLHAVVSQMSNFCFETKKFCVSITFIVLTLLIKFTSNKLDTSLFIAGALIPICFWFLDSVGYYYQVKLRGTMETIRIKLLARSNNYLVKPTGESIISETRINRNRYLKLILSFINHSMWLYVFMIIIDIIVWIMFIKGWIS